MRKNKSFIYVVKGLAVYVMIMAIYFGLTMFEELQSLIGGFILLAAALVFVGAVLFFFEVENL